MYAKEQFEEVTELKSTIKSQVLQMKELFETFSTQANLLNELTPENELLKNWIEHLTHFGRTEVNEIVRIEKFFPGTIEKAVDAARRDFNRDVFFDDFIEGAKTVALCYLKDEISEEQRNLLKKITFNSMTIQWGIVKEYVSDNLTLVPKDVQDLFAIYIYNGTSEMEMRLIEHCRLADAVHTSKAI